MTTPVETPRCGHTQDGSSHVTCTLDRGHKGYHRGYGYVWCCPNQSEPAARADRLTHDAGCERQIYEVCAEPDPAPGAAPCRKDPCLASARSDPPAAHEGCGAAETLTLDRLLEYCADQALLGEDEGHPYPQGNAVEVARDLLTPAARLALAVDLCRSMPLAERMTVLREIAAGAGLYFHGAFHVDDPAILATVPWPEEVSTYQDGPGWRACARRAFGRHPAIVAVSHYRPATEEETAAARARRAGLVGLREPAHREAGVILPELLLVLSALSAVGVLWVALGPLHAAALLAFLFCGAATLRRAPAPPMQEPAPSVQEIERLCIAVPGGPVVEVERPARRRRSGGAPLRELGPVVPHRHERGHTVTELLCALGCGAVVLGVTAALLSGRDRATKLLPECHNYEAVMASKAMRHRCALNAFQRGCDLGHAESCAAVKHLRGLSPKALPDLLTEEIAGRGDI